jgi:hypothetical protein
MMKQTDSAIQGRQAKSNLWVFFRKKLTIILNMAPWDQSTYHFVWHFVISDDLGTWPKADLPEASFTGKLMRCQWAFNKVNWGVYNLIAREQARSN